MLEIFALYAVMVIGVILTLMVSAVYILTMTGLVPSEHRLFKPINRLVDAMYWIDERLARLSFNRKHRDK